MAELTGAAPPALAARPELPFWLDAYVEAYNLLAGSRAAGLAGPLPVPLSEIESYCRLFGWRGAEEVADLVEILQAMDAAYLEVMARRAEERREGEKWPVRGKQTGMRRRGRTG